MKIVVIGSGSKGNSTYIETQKVKILIDAGISYSIVKKRLFNQGIILNKLDAVFITHEHSDHIAHLVPILLKTNAVLHIKKETYDEANVRLKGRLSVFKKIFIDFDTKYIFNSLIVVPIELSHDTKYCMGYLVKELDVLTNNSFASITDTGVIPSRYYKILSTISVVMIESNHDVEMLMNSKRPWILINRILSDHGHLSNEQCTINLKQFVSHNTKKVILAHISEECNDYKLAYENCVNAFNGNPPFELEVAKQYNELSVIELKGEQVG